MRPIVSDFKAQVVICIDNSKHSPDDWGKPFSGRIVYDYR